MEKAIFSARFIQKNGDPIEKTYPTKAAAVRAIKNAHKHYTGGRVFVAWVHKIDSTGLHLVFEVINNNVINKETGEVKSWERCMK